MTGTIPCHVLHFVIKVNNEENRHFDSRIIKQTLLTKIHKKAAHPHQMHRQFVLTRESQCPVFGLDALDAIEMLLIMGHDCHIRFTSRDANHQVEILNNLTGALGHRRLHKAILWR